MYPSTLFSLFPAFPQEDKVFVAMSFAPEFQARWEQVIAPSIRSIRHNDQPLESVRVDIGKVSDSILTEILSGIGTSRLVVADVTQIGQVNGKPVRNANVMYEVGLAQAVRLPEEVLLFRSDKEPLLFDLANVRVNHYDPDGQPAAARGQVASAIVSALKAVALTRHLAVARAAASLDHTSFMVLAEAQNEQGIAHPMTRTMGQALSNVRRERAIERLLEMAAIRARFGKLTVARLDEGAGQAAGEGVRYPTAEFGDAIFPRVRS